MKAENLLEAVDNIDESMLEETALLRVKRKRTIIPIIAAVSAACILLIILPLIKSSAPELKKLRISENAGYGCEDVNVFSTDEILSANPWRENDYIESLPVYENPYAYERETDIGKIKAAVISAAERFGISTENLSVTQSGGAAFVKLTDGDYTVECDDAMTPRVAKRISLPEEFSNADFSDPALLESIGKYIVEKYADFIGGNGVSGIEGGEYDIYGGQDYSLVFFGKGNSPQDSILNYSFSCVRFGVDESGSPVLTKATKIGVKGIGEYPIISLSEAFELLENGKYITDSSEQKYPGKGLTDKYELVYRQNVSDEYFMPYYRFYAEISTVPESGMKTYGVYYVPAVKGEYIEYMPQ